MDQITLGSTTFKHFKTRNQESVSIYCARGKYLKIGLGRLLKRELSLHKYLVEKKFPVAQLLDEGISGKNFYYIEKSIGIRHFGIVFIRDFQKSGIISDSHFKAFLRICKKFTEAQNDISSKKDFAIDFRKAMHVDVLATEIPQLKKELIRASEKAAFELAVMPTVFTHGDFNAFNIFPSGVIDFEYSFWGPAGYDLATNIYSIYLFPNSGGYEYTRLYEFSASQRESYLRQIDLLYADRNLPKPSSLIDHFLINKIMWAAARMGKWPKIQRWRFRILARALKYYLADKPIVPILVGEKTR